MASRSASGQSADITSPHTSAWGKARKRYLAGSGSSASTAKSMTPLSSFSVTCSVSPLVMW